MAICAGLFALAACSTGGANIPVPKLVPFPGTPTALCMQEEVLPKIEEIRPALIRPGSEVTVTASGGYLKDDCGGFNESSRVYRLYFDDEPVADLTCYANHCEGRFVLPDHVAAGAHCMGVQKGSCQLQVQVAGN
jgi:hypothetical protein